MEPDYTSKIGGFEPLDISHISEKIVERFVRNMNIFTEYEKKYLNYNSDYSILSYEHMEEIRDAIDDQIGEEIKKKIVENDFSKSWKKELDRHLDGVGDWNSPDDKHDMRYRPEVGGDGIIKIKGGMT